MKKITSRLPALTREGTDLFYRGTPVTALDAYPLGLAAVLLGMSYTTFWKEVKLGRIRVGKRKRVSRAEIERYLSDLPPLPKPKAA